MLLKLSCHTILISKANEGKFLHETSKMRWRTRRRRARKGERDDGWEHYFNPSSLRDKILIIIVEILHFIFIHTFSSVQFSLAMLANTSNVIQTRGISNEMKAICTFSYHNFFLCLSFSLLQLHEERHERF